MRFGAHRRGLISAGVGLCLMFVTETAQAAWLGGWSYRRPITISHTASNVTNYPILLLISFESGKMKPDFSDLRFTGANGIITLDFWRESFDPSNSGRFWVELPNLPSGQTTIFMYYGNASAASVSNGRATFTVFDDFSAGAVDGNYWTQDVSNGGSLDVSAGELRITQAANRFGHIERAVGLLDTFEILAKVRASANNGGNWSPGFGIYWDPLNAIKFHVRTDAPRLVDELVAGSLTDRGNLSLVNDLNYWLRLRLSAARVDYDVSVDGIRFSNIVSGVRSGWWVGPPARVMFGKGFQGPPPYTNPDFDNDNAAGGASGLSYLDDVRLRRYVEPEPTWGIAPEEVGGACCLGVGLCSESGSIECPSLNGRFIGAGTSCAAEPDTDGDGVLDFCDNCPTYVNPNQLDTDRDEAGDACDRCAIADDRLDEDDDTVPDGCDRCPAKSDIADCNTNLIPDCVEIATQRVDDCNFDDVADVCQASVWIGPPGGMFTVGSNWSPAGRPSIRAELVTSDPADVTCVLNSPSPVSVCTVVLGAIASGRQVLRIDAGNDLQSVVGVRVNDGGAVDLRGGQITGGTLWNAGNAVSGFGRIDGNVVNNGDLRGFIGETLRISGELFENQAAGVVTARVGGVVHITSSRLVQGGRITVEPNATLAFDNALLNAAAAEIVLQGGVLSAGNFVNDGLIEGFGALDGNVNNRGTIVIFADTQIVGNLVNDGTIVIQGGFLAVLGGVSGSGVIIGGAGD